MFALLAAGALGLPMELQSKMPDNPIEPPEQWAWGRHPNGLGYKVVSFDGQPIHNKIRKSMARKQRPLYNISNRLQTTCCIRLAWPRQTPPFAMGLLPFFSAPGIVPFFRNQQLLIQSSRNPTPPTGRVKKPERLKGPACALNTSRRQIVIRLVPKKNKSSPHFPCLTTEEQINHFKECSETVPTFIEKNTQGRKMSLAILIKFIYNC